MPRQIVNTGGQGLASSDAVKAAIAAIVVAAAVLVIFFALNAAKLGDRTIGTGNAVDAGSSSIGAPAPAAT